MIAEIDVLPLVARWLHLLAVIVAVGGAAYTLLALRPAASEALDEPTHQRLRDAILRRWRGVVNVAIAVILITGGFNFYWLALRKPIDPVPYHPVFGVKLLAALFVFFVASVLVGRSPGTAPMRAQAGRWLTALLITAAVVVLLSAVLGQLRTAS